MVRNGLGREADFSYWQCYEALDGPIAQLDRVTDFYSVGCRFESCWDRQRARYLLKPFVIFITAPMNVAVQSRDHRSRDWPLLFREGGANEHGHPGPRNHLVDGRGT